MKSKWYRFCEVKPEHKEEVHVWGLKCGLHVSKYNADFDEFERTAFLLNTNMVTHWHPFPEEPRKYRR